MENKKFFLCFSAYLSFAVFVMQVLLVIVSWILTAVNPELPMRSLLGGDGLRWLFGTFVDNINTPVLVWLLLAGISVGLMSQGNLFKAVVSYKSITDYERMALFIVLWEIAAIVVAIILLAFVPHAVLLSALGTLLPSSFSASVVPVLALSVSVLSLTYGCITGTFRSVCDVFSAMSNGVGVMAPLIILYIVCMEFYCSLSWIFAL